MKVKRLGLLLFLLPCALATAQSPRLSIGRMLGESELGLPLTRVGSIATNPAGWIAIALHPGPQLVILRGSAKPEFISRSGAGPGEIRSPGPIGWFGDTLWVGDPMLARVTLFTSAGKHIRTIAVQVPGAPVLLRDGSVAVIPMAVATEVTRRPVLETIRRVADGKLRDTLVSTTMSYRAFTLQTSHGTMVGQQPFDDFPLWGSFSNGSGFVLVKRAPGTGKAATFSVERFSEKGKLLFRQRYPYASIVLSDIEANAAVTRFTSELPSRNDPAVRRRAHDALYRPKYLPTVSALIAGNDGSIWLGRERTETAMVRWTLLDAKGVVVGDFLAPAGFIARTGTTTSLWGVESDADGVPSIVEYRVPR